MNEFDSIQLSDLRALMAVIREGTVTRAAATLGLTQSALSYQLDRMRKSFGDPLFVRVGNRMAATPFALRLADPATRVLQIVETEIAQLSRFDPKTTTRVFRIGVNEIGAITLVPRLIKRLHEAAPRATLTQMQVRLDQMSDQLQTGAMDIAAGHFPDVDRSLLQQLLYRRGYTLIVSQRHPRVRDTITVAQLCHEQLLESSAIPSTNDWLHALMATSGHASKPPMQTHHASAVPFIVADSELVAIVPLQVYEIFRPIAKVRAVRLPRAIPAIDICQYWHPRLSTDPEVKFFRELIFSVASE
ncbi:MAG TPA: LysR family transcriptional regulator [Ramlibacter sp.]|nr:LysR family transcriptional regulator [Ramlibacter sp.]